MLPLLPEDTQYIFCWALLSGKFDRQRVDACGGDDCFEMFAVRVDVEVASTGLALAALPLVCCRV